MKPLILWRYEAGRAGWAPLLTPPIVAALVAGIAVADTGADDLSTARTFFSVLEMAVPLAAGIGAASLVGRDPATELQLSVPMSYASTLLRRLTITMAWAALVALVVVGCLMATGWWARWPANHGALAGQLTWLAPTLGLGGLGFLAGVVFRSPASAGGVVATFWIVEQIFADTAQEHRWSRLLYPFATTRGTVSGDWAENRLVLVVVGLLLTASGWLLLHRTERLVRGEDG